MTVLVTGAAGFLGYHVAKALLDSGDRVVGVDNLSPYYDVTLKEARLERLRQHQAFTFVRADMADWDSLDVLLRRETPETVVHLAAQPGVRHSILEPQAYGRSNLSGFLNVLEGCRNLGVRHLVFASSSSVYGESSKIPLSIGDRVDHPISLYAATKKANEEMAHAYSHLYGIPTTGIRFFTVYGPWGRPDMAYFSFTRDILAGRPIDLYNFGDVERDFTYVDDVVSAVIRVVRAAPGRGASSSLGSSSAPYILYNLGNQVPVRVSALIDLLEGLLGRKAERRLVAAQPGDVRKTVADVTELVRDFAFAPVTPINVGLRRFVEWYVEYYR